MKLHASYESTLREIAGSLPLSRNILVALLSLQSWKPFMQRWMKASVLSVDAKITPNESDKALKASDDILKVFFPILYDECILYYYYYFFSYKGLKLMLVQASTRPLHMPNQLSNSWDT